MSVTDWSALPDGNATADPSIPAVDGASARAYSALIRGVMAKNAALALDQGGALSTSGIANAYAVTTNSGFATLKPGVSICFRADRDNTDAPTLNVDGNGPVAWLGGDGSSQAAGTIRGGLLYTVAYTVTAGQIPAWRSVGSSAAPIGGAVISAARDPLPPEVAPGRWTVWTNTATGRTSIWANVGGALIDLLTFTLAA